MKNFKLFISLALSVVLMTSCKKDKTEDPTPQNPTVVSTSQSNNAIDVARNQVISVSFSKDMAPATINATTFTVMQGTIAVPGSISYTNKTATFTPTTVLAPNLTYTATVTIGVKDVAGNALVENYLWRFTTSGSTSALATVQLGAAGDYVILAKTAINNNPTSKITGDLGLSPAATSYITGMALTNATGYATASQVTGKLFGADMASPTPTNLTTAVNNMVTAYNDAAARPKPDFFEYNTGNVGGKTLSPGLYKWTSSVTAPTSFTISGSSNDVWIFQVAGNLSLSSAVNVVLSGGAQAKNIFWQVAGTVELGTTSHFEGIIISKTGITLGTGASLTGRALAQTAVILDGNVVTQP